MAALTRARHELAEDVAAEALVAAAVLDVHGVLDRPSIRRLRPIGRQAPERDHLIAVDGHDNRVLLGARSQPRRLRLGRARLGQQGRGRERCLRARPSYGGYAPSRERARAALTRVVRLLGRCSSGPDGFGTGGRLPWRTTMVSVSRPPGPRITRSRIWVCPQRCGRFVRSWEYCHGGRHPKPSPLAPAPHTCSRSGLGHRD